MARLEQGLGQRVLARRAGVTHKAVGYWEAKPDLDLHGYAIKRIMAALGLAGGEFSDYYTRARGRVLHPDGMFHLLTAFAPGMSRRLCKRIAYRRVTCGATTRKGTPCRAKSEPGRTRCKFHGGRSTGPRTEEGRARIAAAQRRRWERWRNARTPDASATDDHRRVEEAQMESRKGMCR
ncbi:HGGxSTG domain-containing protein [Aquicoccus sp.]|uniref:HGGxSTG domain-containing protein n=1 Tax=Aquicoccus sp. TaxID=2055851 RepID=UPI0035619B5A